MGEETAKALGVEIERVKKLIFVVAALMTGAVVSIAGLIGFVGMVVPHTVRMLVGADHRLLLPASALVGGTFLMVADTVARTVLSPTELPVGVVTALIGGPIFMYLLVKRRAGVACEGDRGETLGVSRSRSVLSLRSFSGSRVGAQQCGVFDPGRNHCRNHRSQWIGENVVS